MTFDKMMFIVVKFHLYIEPNKQVCLNWFWHNYFYYIVWHLSDIAENLLIKYSSKDILSISAQFSKNLFHNFKYKTQQYIKPYFSHCPVLISHYKQHLWFLKNYKMHCCCHCQWHFVLVFIANMFIVVTTNFIVLIVIKQCLHSPFSLFSWFFVATLVIIVSVMVNCFVTMLSWFAKWKMINIVHAPFGPKLFSSHFAVIVLYVKVTIQNVQNNYILSTACRDVYSISIQVMPKVTWVLRQCVWHILRNASWRWQ